MGCIFIENDLNVFDKWKNTDDFKRILDACRHSGYVPSFSKYGTLQLDPSDTCEAFPYFNKFKLSIELYQMYDNDSSNIVAKFRVSIKSKSVIFDGDTSPIEFKAYSDYADYISNLVLTIQSASFKYSDLA